MRAAMHGLVLLALTAGGGVTARAETFRFEGEHAARALSSRRPWRSC